MTGGNNKTARMRPVIGTIKLDGTNLESRIITKSHTMTQPTLCLVLRCLTLAFSHVMRERRCKNTSRISNKSRKHPTNTTQLQSMKQCKITPEQSIHINLMQEN
ncbi:hypothetical protein CsSME_00042244 [Camellia sinensis var. sinensis]